MKTIEILGIFSAFFAVLCMTGFDCPECNYVAQTIALCVCVVVALVCGLIIYKRER